MKQKNQWVDYKDLKARVGVLQVLKDFGIELPSHNGVQFYGPCSLPCHGGDRNNPKAFSANAEKNCFRCITHCGGGNVLDLYCLLTNRTPSDKEDFREAALEMQSRYLDDENASPQQASVQRPKNSSETELAANNPIEIKLQVKRDIPYLLNEKKLPLSLLEEFGIGFCSKGMFSGRVVVPLHNRKGNLIGYAGRGMKETDIAKRGRWLLPKSFSKSIELFNQHRALENDIEQFGLVVVEGFWSCLRWQLSGMPVVALMGSDLSEVQLQRIAEITDRVWLMMDNDLAGQKAAAKIIPMLAERVFVRRVNYPEDSDLLQPENFTPDELRALIPV